MTMNEADFLASVTLFSHLKDRDLRRLAKKCEYCFFKPDEVIITEGERDGRLFMLIDGKACVYKGYGSKQEKLLRTLEPPAYFGEIALIDDWVRTATVVAKGDVKAFSLDQWNLRQEIKKYPVIAIELMQMLNRRLLALEKNLINATGGLIPICFNCKKISDDKGAWLTLEQYIRDYTEYEFSQGICPECMQKLKPADS
ncbi:MAG: cyclic nucleotide-binding domain-containing protein [Desulfobacterales bacterium]|nr:cyclic nucleotide-binding domain-containing protein [Desulfobacterales bacterium]MDJ0913907.1 cyclic nucleotide-binding domain-containing protein [Desulfobacterales bacterium]